ncbi:MAG: DUF1343 domain-containing protein [Deltaproteobacteria bacterium]|nr:DUF1343 domain-containing protein [Deltaproteobacteria bacterium]
MEKVLTGLDRFRDGQWERFRGRRLGLLCNQASLDSDLRHAKNIISGVLPGNLEALFGPQHGYGGEDQDNMIETGHSVDRELGIPVYSLYSDYREPLEEMLDLIDVLIIDLQDVGTRVYTFASTMLNCMKAAGKAGKKIVVLDRPNPLGGIITEGNLLRSDLFSFVGPCAIPMRHGLTMGEMALMFDRVFNLETLPEIILMSGWTRGMLWHDTGLRWIMPSPNMPVPETAYVYPGQVIWEGTNLSEGRGTCRPFEIFGAPYLDTASIRRSLAPWATKGCLLQDITFRPTFNKWDGRLCRGFMIHILDHAVFRPYLTSICLLMAVIEGHGRDFRWKDPPYEYEFERMPIDLILGDGELREAIGTGEDISKIIGIWDNENRDYVQWRRDFLLYK